LASGTCLLHLVTIFIKFIYTLHFTYTWRIKMPL